MPTDDTTLCTRLNPKKKKNVVKKEYRVNAVIDLIINVV